MEEKEKDERDLYLRKAIFNLEKQIAFYNSEADLITRTITTHQKRLREEEANLKVSYENVKVAYNRIKELKEASVKKVEVEE